MDTLLDNHPQSEAAQPFTDPRRGGAKWPYAKKIAFANDPLNLLAVKGSLNQQKGDGDAATSRPNKSYWCAYVAGQVSVKAKYGQYCAARERPRRSDGKQGRSPVGIHTPWVRPRGRRTRPRSGEAAQAGFPPRGKQHGPLEKRRGGEHSSPIASTVRAARRGGVAG